MNLGQGRYLNPLVLGGSGDNGGASSVAGANAINTNSAHGLWAFGTDGNGTVEFWDPRSRSSLGVLAPPRSQLVPAGRVGKTVLPGVEGEALSVTALASRSDGKGDPDVCDATCRKYTGTRLRLVTHWVVTRKDPVPQRINSSHPVIPSPTAEGS